MHRDGTILVVDDDPIGRSALISLLVGEGYRLETAADGPSALKIAEEIIPDVILLDVMMPGMDGFEVARRIRAHGRLAEVPILLVTALDHAEARLAGIEAGADDFISKPFDRVELRARVRSIIRLNRFRRLSDEREKYALLFERSPCGILVVDANLTILQANTEANRMLDQVFPSKSERSLRGLVPVSEADAFMQLIRASEASTQGAPIDITTLGLDSREFFFQLTVNAFPAAGTGARLVSIHDMTAQRRVENQFRQAQKMESIGQLASGIAHDFNNLLTAINGFSEVALRELPENSLVREDIEAVREAGERATRLTRQLLAFTRRQSQSLGPIDLSEVVSDLEKMLRRLLGEVEMDCRLERPIGMVFGNAGLVEQILVNLAVNARDAMPNGGLLAIATSEVEIKVKDDAPTRRFVRLCVSDSGLGMTPEVKERLFEPFFTTKEPGKGTGLGLATVYGIVKDLGGLIDVRSAPGQGATFILDFPRMDVPARGQGAKGVGMPMPRGHETILLAEDDDGVRAFARMALEAAGYTVLSGCDGREAMKLERQFRGTIDLLLTDMLMPALSGRLLIDAFKRSRPDSQVIMTSGSAADTFQMGEAQHTHFLPKPYSKSGLLRAVRAVLDGQSD